MKKSVKQTKTKIGREAGSEGTSRKLTQQKTGAKKKAVKKVVLGFRTSHSAPGIVGRSERSSSGIENRPRVGRSLSKENQLLNKLADQVKQCREAKGLSITKLAKSLNAAPASLLKFEEKNGAIPIKLLLQICDKLDACLQVAPLNQQDI